MNVAKNMDAVRSPWTTDDNDKQFKSRQAIIKKCYYEMTICKTLRLVRFISVNNTLKTDIHCIVYSKYIEYPKPVTLPRSKI
jgi:hypothetical protein